MSVVTNICQTYYMPIKTYSKLFESGPSEKKNLAYLVFGCIISFVAEWPAQSRQAFINQQPVDELMGAILLSNLFLLPLIFYMVSMIIYLCAKILKSSILAAELRLIIFWAYLAATPMLLLVGLVEGFLGKNFQYFITAGFWLVIFLTFVYSGFKGRSE
jgi:hypothetical protein|tara:strand:- start:936 stop:1412 length:477 start_codon:yes stop_codon:yes gene_type:complete